MQLAFEEAKKAAAMGEVPVGAIIVKDGEVIATGHNLTESAKDPTAHAEIIAIRKAAAKLGGWRLPGCQMYVTTEPCSMCAGAIVAARVSEVFYGANNTETGCAGTVFNLFYPRTKVYGGIKAEESQRLLRKFFASIRNPDKYL